MRKSRIVAAAIAAIAAAALAVTLAPGAVSAKPAADNPPETADAAPDSARQNLTKIMPLGDSITWGYTIKHGTPVALDGYRKDLWARLHDSAKLSPDFVGSCPRQGDDEWKCYGKGSGTFGDYNHEGHSGFRVHQLSANIERWLDLYEPEIVLLMAGTNDVGKPDAAEAPGRLSAMIDKMRDKRPGTRLFVATIPQFGDAAARARVKVYNDAVARIVPTKGDKVHLVPQHIVGAESEDLSPDNIHPSDCGYAKLSYVWFYYMNRVLNGGRWDNGYWPWSEAPGPCAGP
ncbi:lysophospholipase L1-like esterase [Herbihabitans rhizosphaerae]|uniref:Lysophospholipase L1-like esterase n=1 Tax=Herbihabitans rhizosphaerae TaxID=1872711 RepID=A0A4Q7KBP3_9PSEU|nr:SGNH/GDSL hydrolase family protein [Herbihabitans rhizosphaerae]RZS29652.1 lysophospholipase L1-like esterase [Herbihabitans rhizosphaerae]